MIELNVVIALAVVLGDGRGKGGSTEIGIGVLQHSEPSFKDAPRSHDFAAVALSSRDLSPRQSPRSSLPALRGRRLDQILGACQTFRL